MYFIFSFPIGTFSDIVVIFVCLIIDEVVPSSFSIVSTIGFWNVSFIVFGSIVCPGKTTIVFSSVLLNILTFWSSWFILLFLLSL